MEREEQKIKIEIKSHRAQHSVRILFSICVLIKLTESRARSERVTFICVI